MTLATKKGTSGGKNTATTGGRIEGQKDKSLKKRKQSHSRKPAERDYNESDKKVIRDYYNMCRDKFDTFESIDITAKQFNIMPYYVRKACGLSTDE
jgi:hypothetical protein